MTIEGVWSKYLSVKISKGYKEASEWFHFPLQTHN